MASLSCINDIFEPGNIGSSSGEIAPTPTGGVPFPISFSVAGKSFGATVAYATPDVVSGRAAKAAGASFAYAVGARDRALTGHAAGASFARGIPDTGWLLAGGVWADGSLWSDTASWEDS